METKNQQTVGDIYKNAHIALQSISNVLPKCDNLSLKEELKNEYDQYEKFIGEIASFMKEKDYEVKDVNFMKKAMLWTSINMNTLTDDSTSHLADMMVKGTVMGVTELAQILSREDGTVDDKILEYAKKLRDLEENFEENLKTFL